MCAMPPKRLEPESYDDFIRRFYAEDRAFRWIINAFFGVILLPLIALLVVVVVR
jgi:hypothetical protein